MFSELLMNLKAALFGVEIHVKVWIQSYQSRQSRALSAREMLVRFHAPNARVDACERPANIQSCHCTPQGGCMYYEATILVNEEKHDAFDNSLVEKLNGIGSSGPSGMMQQSALEGHWLKPSTLGRPWNCRRTRPNSRHISNCKRCHGLRHFHWRFHDLPSSRYWSTARAMTVCDYTTVKFQYGDKSSPLEWVSIF